MRILPIIILIVASLATNAQVADTKINSAFQQEIEGYLNHSVPTISVQDAAKCARQTLFLDAREEDEFMISHIPAAKYVGHKRFKRKNVEVLDRDTPIIIYCSIGYRSEKIGEKLLKMGFTNVHNLYGSIFEWANHGLPLEDSQGQPATALHTYNKKWSKWVTNNNYTKVW